VQDALIQQLVSDYLGDASPGGAIVLAGRRSDVHALNSLSRQQLQDHGRLPADSTTLTTAGGPLPLALGEQLIITRPVSNATGRKILNGTRLTVAAVNEQHVTVHDRKRTHLLDRASAAPALQHGYSLTVHKAQGLTVDTAYVWAEGLNHNALYTALSRGGHANHLYAASTPDGPALAGLRRQLPSRGGGVLALTGQRRQRESAPAAAAEVLRSRSTRPRPRPRLSSCPHLCRSSTARRLEPLC